MRVAAVFWGSQPGEGGTHVFGEEILHALREIAGGSRHEFVHYTTGPEREPSADLCVIPSTRRARTLRALIYRLRDSLDGTGVARPRIHTWFERSLAKEEIDVVWFATNYVERCDLPYVLTIFDIEHLRQPWFPEVSAHGEWEGRHRHYSRFVPKATRVIVPNEAGRDQIVNHFRIDPERFLCLGHPTPAFARDAARRGTLPRERVERFGIRGPYLFYPAQFWAHKNHLTLLETLAELTRHGGESYELVLVGSDKGQLDHVRALVDESRVAELVHFLGFVDTEDLIALYQHAHALTYVSFFGPENLPPLEAFALGCPVIAADVPGAQEQLGDAALLVPPTDPSRIAEAVRALEEPTLRDELTKRGRQRAEILTPEAYVRGVIDFLDEFERTRRNWA